MVRNAKERYTILMTTQEKILYHQIHPLKLFTDIISCVLLLFFFWHHDLFRGLIAGFVAPVIVSTALILRGNLDEIKNSGAGKYLHKYMGRLMQLLRIIGFCVMIVGAWNQQSFFLYIGGFVLLLAWFHGTKFLGD
jgi:hypothetical protein